LKEYNRNIDVLEKKAILWWPEYLNEKNANISIVPTLLKTQDDFLNIISLSKESPFHVFDLISATKFPANLFLKHLCVFADYGGEPIQRLGKSFTSIFPSKDEKLFIDFTWNEENYQYFFDALPISGLGNKKLFIDGEGIFHKKELSAIYKDMIVLLMFGSTSTVSAEAGLIACEIGSLLGKTDMLKKYIKERYINVSRQTGGATANSLGQLAQKEVVKYLKNSLGNNFIVTSNGLIDLKGYDKKMPFDVVVEKHGKKIGIEISFQVTTNSTIERKSGQAADRMNLMHANGYKIAYILDGAGNFQRKSALSTICSNSDCTVAYSEDEFSLLSEWIGKELD